MNTFITLLKREYWESKTSFFWVPLIVAGIGVFGALLALGAATFSNIDAAELGSHDVGNLFKLYDVSVNDEVKSFGTQAFLYSALYSFYFVLAIVGFFYCLGALYDDRKDKSILFWKSMPVSDTQTVLSKVASIGLVAPFLFWAATVLSNLIIMLLVTVFAWISDVNAWTALWAHSSFFKISWYQLVATYMAMLWAVPFIGYLLLISSWTKKVPFLVATVPPALVMMAEAMVSNTAYVAKFIGQKLFGVFQAMVAPFDKLATEYAQKDQRFAEGYDDIPLFDHLDFMSYGEQLTDVGFWTGIILGAAMIAGAIYIRRFRDEAL